MALYRGVKSFIDTFINLFWSLLIRFPISFRNMGLLLRKMFQEWKYKPFICPSKVKYWIRGEIEPISIGSGARCMIQKIRQNWKQSFEPLVQEYSSKRRKKTRDLIRIRLSNKYIDKNFTGRLSLTKLSKWPEWNFLCVKMKVKGTKNCLSVYLYLVIFFCLRSSLERKEKERQREMHKRTRGLPYLSDSDSWGRRFMLNMMFMLLNQSFFVKRSNISTFDESINIYFY